jgi:glycerol kinase
MNHIIAIDQSTSSTKALLFDEQCKVGARTNVDHKQYYPQTGWVEHDAEEIYQNMIEAIRLLFEEGGRRKEEGEYSSNSQRIRNPRRDPNALGRVRTPE